jgi:hypothetical protein
MIARTSERSRSLSCRSWTSSTVCVHPARRGCVLRTTGRPLAEYVYLSTRALRCAGDEQLEYDRRDEGVSARWGQQVDDAIFRCWGCDRLWPSAHRAEISRDVLSQRVAAHRVGKRGDILEAEGCREVGWPAAHHTCCTAGQPECAKTEIPPARPRLRRPLRHRRTHDCVAVWQSDYREVSSEASIE